MASSTRKQETVTREFDPSRWAHVVFFAFFLMGAWIAGNLIEDMWDVAFGFWAQVGRPQHLPSISAGAGLAFLIYIYALRRQDWMQFVREVAIEVSQVIWPTRSETRAATIVVIVLTIICSLILFFMDVVWKTTTNWIYGI
ncbi:MAG: preprotein translocase subunit SecE [Nannocystaceae bacterium]